MNDHMLLFGIAWATPLVLMGLFVRKTFRTWGDSKTQRANFAPASVVKPSTFGVSVIALAIPMMVKMSTVIFKTGQSLWLIGFMMSGITLSLVSIFCGAYVVYHCSLTYKKENTITLSGGDSNTQWIAIGMSVQLNALLFSLLSVFVGLSLFFGLIVNSQHESLPTRLQFQAVPLDIGTSKQELLAAWGDPTIEDNGNVAYRLGSHTYKFCFLSNRIHSIHKVNGVSLSVTECPQEPRE